LGYPLERFSTKVIEALSVERIEEALRLILNLYRDIRYSVSPRFELENVIVRLCSLKNWVSQDELRSALSNVKMMLGGGSVENVVVESVSSGGRFAGQNPATNVFEGKTPSLKESFNKVLEDRMNGKAEADQGDQKTEPEVDMVKRIFDGTVIQ
jgi:DNA polymerase-3 subunit gamma/tau